VDASRICCFRLTAVPRNAYFFHKRLLRIKIDSSELIFAKIAMLTSFGLVLSSLLPSRHGSFDNVSGSLHGGRTCAAFDSLHSR
jgi:hypothetical protein